jgi:hypothetical protein
MAGFLWPEASKPAVPIAFASAVPTAVKLAAKPPAARTELVASYSGVNCLLYQSMTNSPEDQSNE